MKSLARRRRSGAWSVLVADNLFELDGHRFQELGLYFLVEFATGSEIPGRDGDFEGTERGTVFQWIRLDELEEANVLVADNLFELDGHRFQELGLYFLVEFATGSEIPGRDGDFEGTERGTVFQWIRLDELEEANLLPIFLRERVREIPQRPEYVSHPPAQHCPGLPLPS